MCILARPAGGARGTRWLGGVQAIPGGLSNPREESRALPEAEAVEERQDEAGSG